MARVVSEDMTLTAPDSKVLIVPGGLLLEFFVLGQFASFVRQPEFGVRILGAIRRLRPDISEFTSFYALALCESGEFAEAREVLEGFIDNQGEESSLVCAILAKLLFTQGDPAWRKYADDSVSLIEVDGGGVVQTDVLSNLPGFEEIFGKTSEGV